MASPLDMVRGAIQEVGIDTQFGSSSVDMSGHAAPRPRGILAQASDWVLRALVKPAPWIKTPAGTARYAPYGEPTSNLVPVVGAVVLGAGVVSAGALVGLGVWLAKRATKPTRRRNPRRRRR